MPLSSTRIGPYFGWFATAIFSPVTAGLEDGLELAVDGLDPPHPALSKDKADSAPNAMLRRALHYAARLPMREHALLDAYAQLALAFASDRAADSAPAASIFACMHPVPSRVTPDHSGVT